MVRQAWRLARYGGAWLFSTLLARSPTPFLKVHHGDWVINNQVYARYVQRASFDRLYTRSVMAGSHIMTRQYSKQEKRTELLNCLLPAA